MTPIRMSTEQDIATSRSPELMAPAGGLEAGCAALHYGADAVYLGLPRFSARADAENFTLEDLDRFTAYAHSLSPARRVFVTLNTLVLDGELDDAVDCLASVADIGVDALIVQDLGVHRIVHRHFPRLRLHASTQMAIHNLEGARALRALGFARVTLARELTLPEIRDIAAGAGIETEVFAHGALCYSYSGLCLFSSLTLGRSGNRGRCAYLCRDRFEADGLPGGFVFSMKDLALPDEVRELAAAGVASLKIEGRMKSPLYVAAAVNYYRRLIGGGLSDAERRACEADIQTIFSRAWTNLHLRSARNADVVDPAFVGHRGTPVGTVRRIARAGGKAWLRFVTARPVERHDGLQVDVPGLDKPYGFGIEEMHLASDAARGKPRNIFEAPAGAEIEVSLPPGYPELPEGATVYCASSQDVRRRYRYDRPNFGNFRSRLPLDVTLRISPQAVSADARAVAPGGTPVGAGHSLSGTFAPARNAAGMEDAARAAFQKLGDTRFALRDFALENPQTSFVPVSQLNEVRRAVIEALDRDLAAAARARVAAVRADLAPPAHNHETREPEWSVKADRVGHLDAFTADDWRGTGEAVVEIVRDPLPVLLERLEAVAAAIGRDRVRLALPIITRAWEKSDLAARIAALRDAGWTRWEASNLSAWPFLDVAAGRTDIHADWSIYVTNRSAAQAALELGAARFTLSPEDGFDNMRALLGPFGARATVIVYQDTPLFIADNCVRANATGQCPGRERCTFKPIEMKSSHGDRVLAVDVGCRTIVIGKAALCLSGQLKRLIAAGASSFRADFVHRPYTPAGVVEIWRALRAGLPVPHTHPGNFDRGLL